MRLDDDDLNRIEQALATLSGMAPRGWVAVDSSLAYLGAVTRDSRVASVMHANFPHSTHEQNLGYAQAVATVLNEAGRLLMEVRRQRD